MANGDHDKNVGTDFPLWLDRFEHAQEIQNEQIGKLTASVSALTVSVGTLDSQQKALFGRANRPYPWGAFVAGLSLIGICAGLLVQPINARLDAHDAAAIRQQEHEEFDAKEMGIVQENLRWLNLMEERLNERAHSVRKD